MGRTQLEELLEMGDAAMVGASVGVDRQPETFRGWGAHLDDTGRLRIIGSSDGRTLANLASGSLVSLTVTCIRTFRSVQVKGRIVGGAEPPGPTDLTCLRRYGRDFGAALVGLGHRPTLGPSIRPESLFAAWLEIDEQFDQTPGPGAGASLVREGA